jgi:hypothetical protein
VQKSSNSSDPLFTIVSSAKPAIADTYGFH